MQKLFFTAAQSFQNVDIEDHLNALKKFNSEMLKEEAL